MLTWLLLFFEQVLALELHTAACQRSNGTKLFRSCWSCQGLYHNHIYFFKKLYRFINENISDHTLKRLFKKLFSHSGQILKLIDNDLSYMSLHKKFNRSTPKIFSIYQTAINLYHVKNNFDIFWLGKNCFDFRS